MEATEYPTVSPSISSFRTATGPASPFAGLAMTRYRLEWTSAQKVDDSQYLGSAWRGVFGHALKRLVCVTRAPQCTECMLYRSCAYPYLFETPGDENAGTATEAAAPHPLILRMESSGCGTGETYRLGIVLVGGATRFLGYVIRALEDAAARGITTREYRFQLRMVRQESPVGSGNWVPILRPDKKLAALAAEAPPIPERHSRIRLRLLTPLRLRKNGSYVSNDNVLGEFAASVLRRLLLMRRYHGPGPVEEDLGGLFRTARELQAERTLLRWHDWTRFSNRQQAKMQMGGLVGEILFSTDAAPEIWPALWTGQFIHAGKAASMGLGAYSLEEA